MTIGSNGTTTFPISNVGQHSIARFRLIKPVTSTPIHAVARSKRSPIQSVSPVLISSSDLTSRCSETRPIAQILLREYLAQFFRHGGETTVSRF